MESNLTNTVNYTSSYSAPRPPVFPCTENVQKLICDFVYKGVQKTVDIKDYKQSVWIWASFGFFTPLCIFGIIGNIITIIMFSKYIKKTTTSVFIVALAFVDLLVCSISMPIQLFVTLNGFHQFDPICRIEKFVTFLACPLSAGILAVIAIDRFLLIFVARTDIVNKFRAKIIIAVVACICLGLAIFYTLAHTTLRHLSKKDLENVCNGEFSCNIKRCDATSSLFEKPHEVAFDLLEVTQYTFIAIVVIFIVLYSLIFVRVYRIHKKMTLWKSTRHVTKSSQKVYEDSNTFTTEYPATNGNATENGKIGANTLEGTSQDNHEREVGAAEEAKLMNTPKEPPKIKKEKIKKRRPPHLQTALTLFLVTLTFIIAYAPMILITMLRVCEDSQMCPDNGYKKFFYYFYFLNHVTNPIIYSFMNPRFKDAVKVFFKKFSCASS